MPVHDDVAIALKKWREGLVGLTRSNRLLNFRAPKRSSVVISAPSADEVLKRIKSGRILRFAGIPASAGNVGQPLEGGQNGARVSGKSGDRDTLWSPREPADLGAVLRNLMRKANTEYLDKGLSVLYASFGMLQWNDTDGTSMQSPILLVPVALNSEGPRGIPNLMPSDEDAVINPALTLRLQDFNINLPKIDDVDDHSMTEMMAQVRSAVRGNRDFPDWELKDTVYLATFSFAKEAMYKDLLDNESIVLSHPVVRALANSDPTQQTTDFQFDPIEAADIDRVAPPEEVPLVLNADSSQRVAVAAALAGRSFVMDGPPGTGKSQTIANMIGALLHAGKTVLFVSEKIAALDVVKDRLVDVGLGNYLLELHSHKASRKDVATELLRSLDTVTKPPAVLDINSRRDAKSHREKLNAYATAMNEIREPLEFSLHYVLGLLAELTTAPSAPVPEVPPTDLTGEGYARVKDITKQLVRSWRPAEQGSSFLWREVTDESSLEIRLYQARSALERLKGTVELADDLAQEFHLDKPSGARTVARLLALQHHDRPDGVCGTWMTLERWQTLVDTRDSLGTRIDAIRSSEARVVEAAGRPWTELPTPSTVEPHPGPVDAAYSAIDPTDMTAQELTTMASHFQATADHLSDSLAAVQNLATLFGLPPVSTFADSDRVAHLVDLRDTQTLPERGWLSTDALAKVRAAVDELRKRQAALESAESHASTLFTAEILKAPVTELQERFTNLHRGLKKLSSHYRADKKALANLLVDARGVKDGIQRLADAVAWGDAARAFDAAAREYGSLLGRYWKGRDTDYHAIDGAIAIAGEAVDVTGDAVAPNLAAFLDGTASADGPRAVVGSARVYFATWTASVAHTPFNERGSAVSTTDKLPERDLSRSPTQGPEHPVGHRSDGLVAPATHSGELSVVPAELLVEPVKASIDWLTVHIAPFRQAAGRIAAVDSATERVHTLRGADEVLEIVDAALRAHRELDAESDTFRDTFGDHFNANYTDLACLDAGIEWVDRLRRITGEPLTERQVKSLETSHWIGSLDKAYDDWDRAQGAILDAFTPSRRSELSGELDSYEDAFDLLDAFRDDTVGQQEWFDYCSARTELGKLGLDTAIDFCVEQRVDADLVPQVLDKALLRAWADATIHIDRRLSPTLNRSRAALVSEYRDLDRKLVGGAIADIVHSANAGRPSNTAIGEPGLIRREGGKQRRHMPVRDLISKANTTVRAIKPVFMMSPLSVSQYLPPDMTFDVVICDEASQVTPGNAINCIYRGKSFILAGDDRQLPPTSFFEHVVDDEDDETDVQDFQSILELAKASAGFNNLGLKWHYRSRHESLIAFSNYKFYEGKLITYPSSNSEGDDVGVELFDARGIYQRGGGAYNPIEARKVAERVVEHFTYRPKLSLGVVTFSVAQADAVQAAVDEVQAEHPELSRYFDTDDRLGGFFIRSLESVQGDERDVMIMSVGYGPDEAGKVSTNFGVLNRDRGWRRLNVAITRARQRVEVVASMRAKDIPPSTNENVEYLRQYLEYAEKGQGTLAITASSTGLQPESPFEESVLATIKNWGYTVEPQVGSAGYRIDMAIRHPSHPGMFSLGIECDGYQYHSAPAARDRDRLRAEVLRGLGWLLHRIWGTAWYRDRAQEERRLRAAIEAANAKPVDGRVRKVEPVARPEVETLEVELAAEPPWTSEYQVVGRMNLPKWVDPAEQGNELHMVGGLVALAEVEGPVHINVVHRRVREHWNVGRVSLPVRENVRRAVDAAPLMWDGEFIDVPDRAISQVRVPNGQFMRKVDEIHLDELALAVQFLVRDVGSVSQAEVVRQIGRLLGWQRTGPQIDVRLNSAVDRAVDRGLVGRDGDRLTPKDE